jgi:hypothetical protein
MLQELLLEIMCRKDGFHKKNQNYSNSENVWLRSEKFEFNGQHWGWNLGSQI